ncbi:hypothetical protein NFI96_030661, partial [Prochilodus magdalenae]
MITSLLTDRQLIRPSSGASSKKAEHRKNSGCQEKPFWCFTILDRTVMAVGSYKFLGTTITKDLYWDCNISSIIKKAQQRMSFLRQLRRFNLSQELMIYHILDITCSSIFPRPPRFSQMRIKTTRLQRSFFPHAVTLMNSGCGGQLMLGVPENSAGVLSLRERNSKCELIKLHMSGKRYRSMRCKTARLNRSFFPKASRLLNS